MRRFRAERQVDLDGSSLYQVRLESALKLVYIQLINLNIYINRGITNASVLRIRAGSTEVRSGGVLAQVRTIYFHPKQNSWSNYDFSLLELKEALKLSKAVQPISLPAHGDSFEDGTLCEVSGWGNTRNANESSLSLRAATVPLYNQEKCSTVYKEYGGVSESMICAGYEEGGKDSCQVCGDEGLWMGSTNHRNLHFRVTPVDRWFATECWWEWYRGERAVPNRVFQAFTAE